MAGEYEFAWPLVNRFSAYHRQSYGGCKAGVGDVLIGAAATIAEYNGVARASHIRDKIVEMSHLNETICACGIACSAEAYKTCARATKTCQNQKDCSRIRVADMRSLFTRHGP